MTDRTAEPCKNCRPGEYFVKRDFSPVMFTPGVMEIEQYAFGLYACKTCHTVVWRPDWDEG